MNLKSLDLSFAFTCAIAVASSAVMLGGAAAWVISDKRVAKAIKDNCEKQGIDTSLPKCTYTYKPFGN